MNFTLPRFDGHRPQATIKALQEHWIQTRPARANKRKSSSTGNWQPPTCQWIDGEGQGRAFCCGPVVKGKPYCQAHCERAYEPQWFREIVDAPNIEYLKKLIKKNAKK